MSSAMPGARCWWCGIRLFSDAKRRKQPHAKSKIARLGPIRPLAPHAGDGRPSRTDQTSPALVSEAAIPASLEPMPFNAASNSLKTNPSATTEPGKPDGRVGREDGASDASLAAPALSPNGDSAAAFDRGLPFAGRTGRSMRRRQTQRSPREQDREQQRDTANSGRHQANKGCAMETESDVRSTVDGRHLTRGFYFASGFTRRQKASKAMLSKNAWARTMRLSFISRNQAYVLA